MKYPHLKHWDSFFHRRVPPHTFSLLRIVFGLFLLLYWYTQWREAHLFSSEYGVFVPLWRTTNDLVLMLLRPSLPLVHTFFAVTFAALLCFIVGFRTRTSALLLLFLSMYFHVWNQWMFATSFYRLYQFSFAVFLLPGADRAFSVAMFRKHGSFFAWEETSILPLRFFALQLCATYLGTGSQKLWLPGWENGDVLRNSFMSRWGTDLGFFLARTLPRSVFDWMVYGSVLLECTMPVTLWIRKLQPIAFIGGFVFHTMITLAMGIWWFQVMVPLYIVFIDPREVFEWLRARSGGRIARLPFIA